VNVHEPAAWAWGLATLVWFVLFVGLAARARRERRGWPITIGVLLGALSACAAAVLALYEDPVAWAIHRGLIVLQSLAWLALLARILRPMRVERSVQRVLVRRAAVGAVGVGAALLPLADPFSQPGPVAHGQLAMGALIALAVIGLVMIEQIARGASRDARWSLKPLLVALGAAFGFDLLLFAEAFLTGAIDREVWAVRGVVGACTVPLIAVGARRSAGWKVNLDVSHRVIYHSTALLGAGIYLLMMAGTGYLVRIFGGDWGRVLQLALVALGLVAFAMLALSGSARARLRVEVAKNFLSSRFDHRAEWMKVSRRLADAPAGDLPIAVVQILADLVESPGGALWLRKHGEPFRQTARWNAPEVAASEPSAGPLPAFLEARGWIIDIDEASAHPERYPGLALSGTVDKIPRAWLIVPLISARELVGFVILVRPRAPITVDWEVRDLLKAAAYHAASHLSNASSTERLLEASKFDAFNRMSAFVVHDIKNLVAQLSLLSRNAERHMANPEFQADLLSTVRHVTERMNHLLTQLRAGATPVANAASVDLRPLVERVVRGRRETPPAIQLTMPSSLMVLGHEDRLERVVRNLIANAQDATRDGSPVVVRGESLGDNARLEILDRGVGMSPEFLRDRLFRPFSTTKPNGMGIGAYESHQYVRELGGRIDVESREGEGTQVVVTLPVPGVGMRSADEPIQRAA
jgi:putative PEP-CTERM system histidine kinase